MISNMQEIKQETIKPQHDVYRGSATRTLFPCPTPRTEYPTRELLCTTQQAPLSGGEKPYTSLTPISDTKLNVEFFYKGTTTPDSSFTRVQQLPLTKTYFED